MGSPPHPPITYGKSKGGVGGEKIIRRRFQVPRLSRLGHVPAQVHIIWTIMRRHKHMFLGHHIHMANEEFEKSKNRPFLPSFCCFFLYRSSCPGRLCIHNMRKPVKHHVPSVTYWLVHVANERLRKGADPYVSKVFDNFFNQHNPARQGPKLGPWEVWALSSILIWQLWLAVNIP